MIKLVLSLLFILMINDNIITNILKDVPLLNYWDETLFLLFMLFLFCGCCLNKRKLEYVDGLILIFVVIVIVIGVCGNYIYMFMEDWNVIVRDIVGFAKFFGAYVCAKYLKVNEKILYSVELYGMPILRGMVIVIFLLGIVSLFVDIGLSQPEYRNDIHPYQFLFVHPTFLVSACVIVMCVFYKMSYSNICYEVMISVIIILSLRTKGLVWLAVYYYFKYMWKYMKNYKKLFVFIMLFLIFLVSYDKVNVYMDYTDSPRQSLYYGSLVLALLCFPIGTGFGSFATGLSGKYGSAVYNFIPVSSDVDWNDEDSFVVLGDAGWPYYIGQFGFLGTLCIIILMYLLFYSLKKKHMPIPGLLVLMYIIIALPSENMLVNLGVQYGIVLAMMSVNYKERDK